MKFSELLLHLQDRQIRVWVEQGRLRYQAPKGALDDELRQALSQHKAGLTAFLQGREPDQVGLTTNEGMAGQGQPVVSFAQEGLWILHKLKPEDPSYNRPLALRLRGRLDQEALAGSLQKIVRRQETLRTVYRFEDGRLCPVVQPWQAVPIPQVDLSGMEPAQRGEQLNRFLVAEARRPFDLENGPVLRCHLIRVEAEEHVLLTVVHHIAFDAWSARVFANELSNLYAAFQRGEPPAAAGPAFRYRDYASWQRHRMSGAVLDGLMEYWRSHLQGAPPVIELPTDHPYPPVQTYHGRRETFTLPQEMRNAVQLFSQQQGVTPFMTLLAAYAVLLFRYSGQEDLVIGVPVAGRNHAQVEGLIGCFINTLPLRLRLEGEKSIAELLQAVSEAALEGFAHQELPLEYLVQELHPQRDSNRSPVFQILFNLRNVGRPTHKMGELEIEEIRFDYGTAQFDLTLDISEREDGLGCAFEYNCDLFEAGTMERAVGHFRRILEAAMAGPEMPVARLPMLAPDERHLILSAWSGTAGPVGDSDLLALFARQAAARPEAVAFIGEGERLTYRALGAWSDRLARRLKDLGAQMGMRIGVCLERSLAVPAVVLAIFKLGGVYVPLDPGYPTARLQLIQEDAGIRILVTRRELRERLAPGGEQGSRQPAVLLLEAGEERAAETEGEQWLPSQHCLEPDGPACIVYTSGSTGRPKGAVIPHGMILNRLEWMWQTYPFSPTEVGCVKTALNFIDSLWELFGYLLQGVPAVMIPDATLRSPQALVERLAETRVTQLWLVPTLLRLLLDSFPDLQQRLPHLRWWISSGEQLPTTLLERFNREMPQATLCNLYGTSEVWDVTWFHPDENRTAWSGPAAPIGKPIRNLRTYILDAHLQPAPVNVSGELWVGGLGPGNGYVDRPELTAERFLPDPFCGEAGRRMYRTGDLACWLADGNIQLLGRGDFQVKIRGFRIEPAEIEALLEQHPAIQQAVVIPFQHQGEETRLAGFFVAEGEAPASNELLRYLRERLPEYMLPARLVALPAFPLTPSGKIDRRGLPGIDTIAPAGAGEYVEAQTELQRKLARMWAELLGLPQVGIEDNFFDLGGHSLLGIKLFAQIEAELGARLPVGLLFQAPTVALLAEALGQSQGESGGEVLVPIKPGGAKAPFFCVHGFGGGVLGYAGLARLMDPEQPFYGLLAAGLVQDLPESEEIDTTIPAMAARFVAAIRRVQPHGPYHLGGYCFGGVVAYEMACQLEAQGEKVGVVGIMEGSAPRRFHKRRGRFDPRRLWAIGRYFNDWVRDYGEMGMRPWLSQAVKSVRKMVAGGLQRLGVPLKKRWQDAVIDPVEVIPDRQREILQVHWDAIQSYAPGSYRGRVTLFRVRYERISSVLTGSMDPEMGWGSLAQGGVDIHYVDGFHRNIHLPPYVGSLARALQKCLDERTYCEVFGSAPTPSSPPDPGVG